jgi:hypothetical protein
MTNVTATDESVDAVRLRARTIDRLQRRREPPLGDTTATVRQDRAARRDDGSHMPPHGDAVLPHTSLHRP